MVLPYKNQELTIRERVEDLLNRMNLKEKIGQVNQHLYGWQMYNFDSVQKKVSLSPELINHIEWGGGLGAIYGLFRADPWSKVDYKNGVLPKYSWKVSNAIQKAVIEHSRLGIPTLITEECPHGHQGLDGVSYPTNIGRGNSFNPDLIRKSSHLMAKELALKGVNLALVSTLDLAKDPRWGRTEECFGEDPILSAKMSEAVVEGFQGSMIQDNQLFLDKTVSEINRQNDQIGVVLKHCIAQGEAQGGHNSGTVVIGEREFNEIYLPLLKSTKNAAGVMAAYNDINGVPCHINQKLLKENLREKAGFQGLVMADGVALDRIQDALDDEYESAGAALNAGVDLSLWDNTYTKIESGIKKGIIKENDLDNAVRRVLAVKFLLGLFEHPYVEDPGDELLNTIEESQKINKLVAESSITMVKNDGVLPLKDNIPTIGVIGPNADKYYNLLGDYTAPQQDCIKKNTILSSIRNEFKGSKVLYAEGCEIRNQEKQSKNIKSAIEVAEQSDIVIMALGGSSARNFDMEFLSNGAVSSKGINMDSGENVDVSRLELGGLQNQLFEQIEKLNKPMITILIQGRPYNIEHIVERSNAVLIGWFPGQMGGKAIANILAGKYNPSGKLSVSYPRNSQQLPVYYYQRAASKKDDYYDEKGSPLLSFGYGISYTKFIYSDLGIQRKDNQIRLTVTVTNKGEYNGSESVLLFVKLYGGNVVPRHKLLKNFKKVNLGVDESQRVIFNLDEQDLKIYNDLMECQVANKVDFLVGGQKATLKL